MFPLSFTMYARLVEEGIIFWTDYYGFIEVWTQGKGYGDLIYQFGCQCSVDVVPYELIMDNYHDGNLSFEGDEKNVQK